MSEPRVLDGRWLASRVQVGIGHQVKERSVAAGRPPGLGVVLVGDNPASKAYVGRKEKIARRCGFATFDFQLPANAAAEDVRSAIQSLNSNAEVDGILLQLPLPDHLIETDYLDLIDPDKDADGLHPRNQGLLMRGAGKLRPCTPMGIMKLIDLACSDVTIGSDDFAIEDLPAADLSGKQAVVLGRSILVGKAVSFLLLERNATVTMAHSRTQSIESVAAQADIVVAAVGVPHLVKADWVKAGAIVIDVGINRTAEGKLTGDVDFEAAAAVAAAITPVPGGVGPMTVAMLMQNTFESWSRKNFGADA